MKRIIGFTLFFILGFLGHYSLTVLFPPPPSIHPALLPPQIAIATQNDFITYVNYENGIFNPNRVTIKLGNYIAITNKNKTEQMWLESSNRVLSTVRGYAESERLQTTLSKAGTYLVKNKLNPEPVLEVTVVK